MRNTGYCIGNRIPEQLQESHSPVAVCAFQAPRSSWPLQLTVPVDRSCIDRSGILGPTGFLARADYLMPDRWPLYAVICSAAISAGEEAGQ